MTSTGFAERRKKPIGFILVAMLSIGLFTMEAHPGLAGEADVVGAKASETAPGIWRFDVTVRHGDEGWDHYANRWDVIGPDGKELGVRVLAHPHETEQPFTRSLGGVKIPEGTPFVMIRANDSVHDLGGAEFKVPLK